jgi:hypothetical protein
MFEKATRKKLRFESPIGALSVEDLWDIPLTSTSKTNLDDIARALYRQLKSSDDVSFVKTESKSDETVQLKFDIVKHIIDVKVAEREAAQTASKNRERRQQILEIINRKENENLANSSIDELRKLAEALG